MRATIALLLLLSTSSAEAYVRSRTSGSTAIKFDSACVFVQADTAGSVDVAFSDVTTVIDKCISNWQGISTCSYLELKQAAAADQGAAYDGKNVVQFLSDKWCHPADKTSPERCYDSAAAAITTVFFLDRPKEEHDGTIIDADIEMNEVNFTFIQSPTAKTVRKGTAEADFENTLTHEMGHLMGLDHTCADSSTPANALDNNGVRPVSCDQLKTLAAAARSVIEEATMFNRATPGETKKRTPEADDIAGICEAYPSSGKVPTRCAPVDLASYNSGCQIAPSSSAPAWPSLLLLGVVGFVLARRLRRRAA